MSRTLSESAEGRAQKAVAVTFFLLAPYIAYDAITTLIAGDRAATSWLGVGIAAASVIVMPLLGWLALSAAGKPVPFFGLELPPLTTPDKDFAHTIEEIHETIGTIGYYLVGAHAAAALFRK